MQTPEIQPLPLPTPSLAVKLAVKLRAVCLTYISLPSCCQFIFHWQHLLSSSKSSSPGRAAVLPLRSTSAWAHRATVKPMRTAQKPCSIQLRAF